MILGTSPGSVRGEIRVTLSRPRDRNARGFKELVDHIYAIMTNPQMEVRAAPGKATTPTAPRFPPLPHALVGGISGLLELILEKGGKEDIPALAERLGLDVDDLRPILDAAALLGFAEVAQADMAVNEPGRTFAEADIQTRKQVFQNQVLQHAPLVVMIYHTLQEKANHAMPAAYFLDILDEHYPEAEARKQFETAVDWGRCAELFEFNAGEGKLYLP